jgi:hypothetical protein
MNLDIGKLPSSAPSSGASPVSAIARFFPVWNCSGPSRMRVASRRSLRSRHIWTVVAGSGRRLVGRGLTAAAAIGVSGQREWPAPASVGDWGMLNNLSKRKATTYEQALVELGSFLGAEVQTGRAGSR